LHNGEWKDPLFNLQQQLCHAKRVQLKKTSWNEPSYDKCEGPMRVSRFKELKANLRQKQTCFTKIEIGNVAFINQEHCCWTDWLNIRWFETTVEGRIIKIWTFFYCYW
jgi:hypothetical protein